MNKNIKRYENTSTKGSSFQPIPPPYTSENKPQFANKTSRRCQPLSQESPPKRIESYSHESKFSQDIRVQSYPSPPRYSYVKDQANITTTSTRISKSSIYPSTNPSTQYPCYSRDENQLQNQDDHGDKNSREVRNETQKRYRERQRQKETTILASVQMLRERRMGYELNRDMMKEMLHKIHTTNSQRRVMIVQEYHKLFENGYGLTASIREKQEEFIYTRIHWKCRIQDELNSGPRDLLKQWKYLSQVLSHFSISINQINVYGNMDIIVARGQVNFEVTRKSIEMYFPHLLQENSVVKQLEGRLMELKILIHYYFDDYQIVSIQIEHNGTIELWKIFEDLLTVKKILSTPKMEKKS